MNYQFTSRQLTLDYLSRSNQGHMTSKGLHLLNGASSYQILHETHIVNHIWSFSLPPLHLILGGIERSNQRSLGFQLAIFHELSTFWP